MEVIDAIRTKKAVRQFSDQPVSHEDILTILDAARHSQSSKNTQPWQFVVVQDRAKLKALSKTGDYAQHLAGATFAVVFSSRDNALWTTFDLGQASSYMQLAAWSLGIGSCIAAIYRADDARKVLGIPPEMQCMAAISFGYPSADYVPLKLGGRKSVDELVHWNQW